MYLLRYSFLQVCTNQITNHVVIKVGQCEYQTIYSLINLCVAELHKVNFYIFSFLKCNPYLSYLAAQIIFTTYLSAISFTISVGIIILFQLLLFLDPFFTWAQLNPFLFNMSVMTSFQLILYLPLFLFSHILIPTLFSRPILLNSHNVSNNQSLCCSVLFTTLVLCLYNFLFIHFIHS